MKLRVHTKPSTQYPKGRIATLTFDGPGSVVPGATETLLRDEASGLEYRFDTATGHFVGWGVFGKSAQQFRDDVDNSIAWEVVP